MCLYVHVCKDEGISRRILACIRTPSSLIKHHQILPRHATRLYLEITIAWSAPAGNERLIQIKNQGLLWPNRHQRAVLVLIETHPLQPPRGGLRARHWGVVLGTIGPQQRWRRVDDAPIPNVDFVEGPDENFFLVVQHDLILRGVTE